MGLVFMFTGLIFLTLLYFLSRRRYLRLRVEGVSIDKRAIEQVVDRALQPIFPGTVVATDVIVRGKRKLEILADIPYPSEEKMTVIENTLKESLSTQLGYHDGFTFNIGLNQ